MVTIQFSENEIFQPEKIPGLIGKTPMYCIILQFLCHEMYGVCIHSIFMIKLKMVLLFFLIKYIQESRAYVAYYKYVRLLNFQFNKSGSMVYMFPYYCNQWHMLEFSILEFNSKDLIVPLTK